jgi:hypothetical protein
MVGEADHVLHATDEPIVDENKSAAGTESDAPASSSANAAVKEMVNKTTPSMSDYWKKSTITEDIHSTYHVVGWLGGRLESIIPTVECPMVVGTTVVCFESHLIAGLGLPPSKFLVAIMNILRCELVHLNLNAIAALSYFAMLYECWLGITPDTSLLWYFYSPACYDKTVYSGIGLSLCHSRRQAYIDATFKISWRGSSQQRLLVDMHVAPHWVNRHLLPPLINNKRGEPKKTPRLAALVKRVAKLHDASLRACHCVEEFTLQQICPLGRWDMLAYEWLQLNDSSRDPAAHKIFKSLYCC